MAGSAMRSWSNAKDAIARLKMQPVGFATHTRILPQNGKPGTATWQHIFPTGLQSKRQNSIRLRHPRGARDSFHPEMVYSANLCVNLRDCLCGVARHASARLLDCLDIDEISSFLNWKRQFVPIPKEVKLWMDTSYNLM